jgi:hypothetical protein
MKIGGRPEPVVVAMTWDDLWLGVICLSNPEIAGSPRKVYGDRVMSSSIGCRALDGRESASNFVQSNSECRSRIIMIESRIGLS